MRLMMLGVNHRTASLDLRERLAVSGDGLGAMIDRIRRPFGPIELVVLSTCNRTELYVARPTHEPPSVQDLRQVLADHCGVAVDALTAASIHREQHEAAAQLFRVCSGLDSMVLGEAQILGQVKRAYEAANARGAVGPVLHRVFQDAIASAKRVRAESGIDAGRVSVGSVAVDLARNVFERFDDKTVVAVGAGEMMKVALRHFRQQRPAKLWIANRTTERAAALARSLQLATPADGGARAWEDLAALLLEADVLLTCTGAAEPIITAAEFRAAHRRRRNRPLLVIDLGVPRDVEPAVASFSNVYLYNIDDLKTVIDANQGQRFAAAAACEAMLAEQVRATVNAIQHQDLGQLVRQLRERLESLGRGECDRTARRLMAAAPDDYEALLAEHTHRLINKILHLPLSQIDRRNADAPLGFYAAALRRLFALDHPPAEDWPDATASAAPARDRPQSTHAR